MFPGKKSKWKGFDRSDFVSAGRQATVVVTKKVHMADRGYGDLYFGDCFLMWM